MAHDFGRDVDYPAPDGGGSGFGQGGAGQAAGGARRVIFSRGWSLPDRDNYRA